MFPSQIANRLSRSWLAARTPVDQILAEENVDNGSNETVQWTLTDHVNALTAHWTDQLNTVWDISVRHNPGYCQLRPTNAWQRGPKAGQPRFGGGKGATTVVNHLIYDAFGRDTGE